MVLLVGDDDIDVVGTAETVVGDREETISIRWEVDAYDFRAFVGHDVEETWILVGEAIVILSLDGGGKENIEGRALDTPLDFIALLNLLVMLIYMESMMWMNGSWLLRRPCRPERI